MFVKTLDDLDGWSELVSELVKDACQKSGVVCHRPQLLTVVKQFNHQFT
ncbi:hypothetical protein [Rubidibacter lacunae]|nr:hypothetical protein [Rubidibacter lacunae]